MSGFDADPSLAALLARTCACTRRWPADRVDLQTMWHSHESRKSVWGLSEEAHEGTYGIRYRCGSRARQHARALRTGRVKTPFDQGSHKKATHLVRLFGVNI
jgi:hypothetical protein